MSALWKLSFGSLIKQWHLLKTSILGESISITEQDTVCHNTSPYPYIVTLLPVFPVALKVPPSVEDVMHLCDDISAKKKRKVRVRSAGKGALMAGGSAFVGGLLGGPPGIAVGGVIGGLLGGWTAGGQFRPLPQILAELPPAQRQKLYEDVSAVLLGLDWTDAALLLALVMGNPRMEDVMCLCCDIPAQERIKVAVRGAGKGALMAGGSAFVGGLLGGPPGIAVGGVVGGLLGGWMAGGQFRPLPQILAELPPAQQQKLYEDVLAVLFCLDWTEAD
ncbi:uncharacterized protein LOC130925391 [Corythoichthys intestinalis]|uniref:uncharacterized protein LOC130925391 n=1 Tax=Corythoichthys intestinalis TaxID=161448 RepID=UPI0025A5AA92|nr:uncharacterized protein LOC130925391 [Corythoichthys intestinalis]